MKWSRIIPVFLVVALAMFIFSQLFLGSDVSETISLTEAAEAVQAGTVSEILVQESKLEITLNNGTLVEAYRETDAGVGETLSNLGVPQDDIQAVSIVVAPPSRWGGWINVLATLLPLILIGVFFFFILRQAQGAGNQAMSFGKSKARMFTGDKPTVTFDDVAGVEESKAELQEVVEFLREPEKFISLGARIPKGVLMVGVPGCGKTLLAKAVSGEAGVPFFSISGSEFVEMFVGVGASRVRDLFEQAKRNSPCIIFIDEIDAVGRHRGAGLGGSHDEREQTLNQILVEMDGFETDTNIIIIAATNRPDILDPALLRPGRFDRRVILDRPDHIGREKILKVHVRGKPLAADVDLSSIAKMTVGLVGADLENLVNEAAILTARRGQKQIHMQDFEKALEKILMGVERRSRVINEQERWMIAYHEAGHALVAKLTPGHDPVHKISIVARGQAGGVTMYLPEDDTMLRSENDYKARLQVLMGGRAAEHLAFESISTGASNDLQIATKAARAMVTQYGMSKVLGPLTYGQKDDMVFLGKEIGEQRNYSEEAARSIDLEVRNLLQNAQDRALKLLQENKSKLDEIANKLIVEETIDGVDFEAMFA